MRVLFLIGQAFGIAGVVVGLPLVGLLVYLAIERFNHRPHRLIWAPADRSGWKAAS